jgi:hypothetical protein
MFWFVNSLRAGSGRAFLILTASCWHIPLLCVQWKTADDGQRNCPKHVKFHSKNKFEKLVHLVGFIIKIYHDARSSDRQMSLCCTTTLSWHICIAGNNTPYTDLHVKCPMLHWNKRLLVLLVIFFRRSLAIQIVMTGKWMRSSSVLVCAA